MTSLIELVWNFKGGTWKHGGCDLRPDRGRRWGVREHRKHHVAPDSGKWTNGGLVHSSWRERGGEESERRTKGEGGIARGHERGGRGALCRARRDAGLARGR